MDNVKNCSHAIICSFTTTSGEDVLLCQFCEAKWGALGEGEFRRVFKMTSSNLFPQEKKLPNEQQKTHRID